MRCVHVDCMQMKNEESNSTCTRHTFETLAQTSHSTERTTAPSCCNGDRIPAAHQWQDHFAADVEYHTAVVGGASVGDDELIKGRARDAGGILEPAGAGDVADEVTLDAGRVNTRTRSLQLSATAT